MQRLKSWQLFAVCVLTWATTWHAVTYQIAPISPELGVGVRFGLAGLLVVGACLWRGIRLPSTLRDHAMLDAARGVPLRRVVCLRLLRRAVRPLRVWSRSAIRPRR
jgi:drug/metabolite transporter (DMT)-like permease